MQAIGQMIERQDTAALITYTEELELDVRRSRARRAHPASRPESPLTGRAARGARATRSPRDPSRPTAALQMVHASLELAVSCGVYKAQLVAYLTARNLDAARFLWKRLPAASKAADGELASLWAIGKAMVRAAPARARAEARASTAALDAPDSVRGRPRRTARVHARREMPRPRRRAPAADAAAPAPLLVSRPASPPRLRPRARAPRRRGAQWTGDRTGALAACEAGWSPLVAPAVDTLRAQLRAHAVALLGRSTCAIALADCCAMLRLPEAETLELARRHGWAVAADGTLAPTPLVQLAVQQQDLGMGQLQQLTRLVAQLD